MLAPLLVLFVGFIGLPIVLVASLGRGGPILWVGGIAVVCWLGEVAIDRVRRRGQRRLADADRCLGCGHRLIPVQQRCPECDRARHHPSAAAAAANTTPRHGQRFSITPVAGLHDVHR